MKLPLASLAILLCLCGTHAWAQTSSPERQEIRPPFGFTWGESPDRTKKMLEQAGAKILEDGDANGRRCFHVRGIAQRLLRDAYFYFDAEALSEIELHYGEDTWDIAKFTEFFEQTRRHIDSRYGVGRLVARTKTSQNGITSSLTGYQWSQYGATLQIFLYSAEKGAEVIRVLSLHYRGS